MFQNIPERTKALAFVFVLAHEQAISPNAVKHSTASLSITRKEVRTSNRKVAVSACVDRSVTPGRGLKPLNSFLHDRDGVGFIRTICAPVINLIIN